MAQKEFSACSREAGNALFLVLVAIMLFAALSYAITQSDRGGGMARSETAEIAAARLIEFAGTMSAATTRLRVGNGCDDNELSFDNTVVAGYGNGASPATGKCLYFSPAGAGMGWTDGWFYSGANIVHGVGTGDPDLLAIAPIADLQTCLAINRKFNLPAQDETSLGQDFTPGVKFDGNYLYGNDMIDDGGNMSAFLGAHDACVKTVDAQIGQTGGPYFYYHVLVER